MILPPQTPMMMNQAQIPPSNSYVPVNHSSSGSVVPKNQQNSTNSPLGPGQPTPVQYPINQAGIMHSVSHMKLNPQSQPVHMDPQNSHAMMSPPSSGGIHMEANPHIMGSPQGSRGEPTHHIIGSPAGVAHRGPIMQHPNAVRPMMPPSSSPLSSPSSSSEHSIIQHGPQPMPSAPSATSTPQPEEKEEVAELISFD